MRRFAALGAALATTVAFTVPVLVSSADASTAHRATSASSAKTHTVDRKKAPKLKVKRSKKGVQPGITGEKITALPGKAAKGKVKFLLKGTGLKQARKVKIKKGRAAFKVPPLGTGQYKVKVSYRNRKGATKFEVYDSSLTVNQTSFTVSHSDPYANVSPATALSGSVKYKGKPATEGFIDTYKDGNVTGGESSPDYLDSTTVPNGGVFEDDYFATRVGQKYPPGTYNFQAFYQVTAEYGDYLSSSFITVVVTP